MNPATQQILNAADVAWPPPQRRKRAMNFLENQGCHIIFHFFSNSNQGIFHSVQTT